MKTALLCASAVFGGHSVVFATAAATNVQISRRNVRGFQPGLDAVESAEPEALAEQLPAVPPPADIGPDGFPQLPTVTNLMNSAQSTAQSLSAQAKSLETRVAEVQKEKAARMAKQKEIFELKLRDQEQDNRDLLAQNKKVTQQIEQLKTKNGGITQHANELHDANVVMRSELAALQSSLKTASDFVKQSLSTTDDSHDTELEVLDAKVQANLLRARKTEVAEVQQHLARAGSVNSASAPVVVAAPVAAKASSDEDSDDEYADDDSAASLLAISSEVREEPVVESEAGDSTAVSDPKKMLLTLEKEVQSMQTQEQAGEKQLKEMFFKDFQVGAQRKSALVAQQKVLNATRDSLTSLQGKLKVAEGHLQSTKGSLASRLHQLGTFIQKLGHLSMAPASEVPHLLQSLPASVAVPGDVSAAVSVPTDALAVDKIAQALVDADVHQ